VLHHEKRAPVSLANVMERADVRVIQAGDDPCLALETRAAIRVT
jgi:hypothetical protein